MALMVCPECGKQVSDQAGACPHCGYPISKHISEQREKADVSAKEVKSAAEAKSAQKNGEEVNTIIEKSARKPIPKKKIVIVGVIVMLLIAGLFTGFIFGFKRPYDAACANYSAIMSEYNVAVKGYESVIAAITEQNSVFDGKIDALNDLVYSETDPYDMTVEETAINLISKAKSLKYTLPQAPTFRDVNAPIEYTVFQAQDIRAEVDRIQSEAADITAATVQMVMPDYSAVITEIESVQAELENSILQNQQVTNPSEGFVIERLTDLPGITTIEAATEDNDPNGNLHKAGGYTSAVFFIYEQVTDPYVLYSKGSTPVERGTDGGGCIEVYATREDAENRNTYLACFDGGAFSSGSHAVCGTIVVRTSSELTATQQNNLEDTIIAALIEVK